MLKGDFVRAEAEYQKLAEAGVKANMPWRRRGRTCLYMALGKYEKGLEQIALVIDEASRVIRIRTIADLGAPPSLAAKPPQIDIAKPEMAMPKVGIPTPVADDEVADEDVVIATRDELKDITAPAIASTGDQNKELVIDIPEEDYMPPADSFVAVEVNPVQVYEETPEYPRLARDGGFTGYVIVQAFVDKNGTVKKAQAVKCSRPNMGFEDAAVKAAYKGQWKPAIQNGNPIGVWVAYRVDFVQGD
jgi:TonB family protein